MDGSKKEARRNKEKDVTVSFHAGLTESVLCSFIFQLVKQEVVSVATLPVLMISAKSAFISCFLFTFLPCFF